MVTSSCGGVCVGGGWVGCRRERGEGCTVNGMSKERTKSRPVSFRVPLEVWAELAGRAQVRGVSPGKWAEAVVMEALRGMGETVPEAQAYTGTWGAEAAMPPERDQTPAEAAYQAEIERNRERQARLAGLRGILPEDHRD